MNNICDYQRNKMSSPIRAAFLLNPKNGVVRNLDGVFIGKFYPLPISDKSKFTPRKTKVKTTNQ
jgi:hypothetical protein